MRRGSGLGRGARPGALGRHRSAARSSRADCEGRERIVATATHQFEGTVGAVVSSAAGALLVAGRDSLVVIDDDGRRPLGPPLLPPGPARRFNDGGCDPAGRFLIGSLALDDEQAARHAEALFRLEFDGSVSELDADLGLSNGLAWSPDGTEFYSIDTVPGIVWVRSYEPVTGAYGERRVLLDIDGAPDGMCVDEHGNLWIAIWGAGEIRCYTPMVSSWPSSGCRPRTRPASRSSARTWAPC